ncbi:MAG: DoxX family protein [Chloroflexi bacterium]|nr:DoxX family protein [Chloroflexota bacterium]
MAICGSRPGGASFRTRGRIGDGSALKAFRDRAIVTDPTTVVKVDGYRDFLTFLVNAQAYTWFSKMVLFGEMAIGIALILGAFTGLAAFGGSFMNWNFIMAGSASTNGLLFAVATLPGLAWKTSGYIRLDRYLLPLLGTPRQPGFRFDHPVKQATEAVGTDQEPRAA